MPLYDYKCQQHGVFSELTTIANMESPVDCPNVGWSRREYWPCRHI